jgi:putative membrane protein
LVAELNPDSCIPSAETAGNKNRVVDGTRLLIYRAVRSTIMSTLVVSVDRGGDVRRKADIDSRVVGWEAMRELVTEVGLADPEDSAVNSLLEALRVTQDLEEEGESAEVALVSGAAETMVGSDRSVASQMDDLVAEHNPDSVIVVIDSAEDERLVPIIESRVRVDSVDRVVVRQAHDLESTYYLLKQFLADEELRGTVLVPIGVALLAFPILSFLAGIDDYFEDLPAQARDAFYSGRVSIVTYVVAVGLGLIGLFAGALGVSSLDSELGVIVSSMGLVYHSVPWLALAALAASTGRLFDEVIRNERVSSAYLNLPFGVIATGIVVRGFSAYFLQRSGAINPLFAPELQIGTLTMASFPFTPEERLALFVVAGVLVSLAGVRIAAFVSGASFPEQELAE